MRATIRGGLVAHIPATLVDELIATYEQAKRNFYLGGHRLTEVEAGRFCEAAFRILEERTTGTFTALGTTLDTDKTISKLGNLPRGSFPDSIRLHIPRALRLVYDIRNQRDAAHLADGIDPNLQDATAVTSTLDWVLAEFVRLYHNVPPDEAHRIVDGLVTRTAPVIQEFDGFLKVLNPALKASDHALILLYHCGSAGATLQELREWVRPSMRANISRTLRQLVEDKDFAHVAGDRYKITRRGELDVERRRLLDPA